VKNRITIKDVTITTIGDFFFFFFSIAPIPESHNQKRK
jgi:hypothetical protein